MLLFSSCIVVAQSIDKAYVLEKNKQASELNREGRFDEAHKILEDLLKLLEAQNADPKFFLSSYQTQAKVIQNLGQYQKSSEIARKSLEISLKLKDSFNIADTYNTIGVNHYFLADYDSTTYYYQKSFDIKKRIKTNEYALAVSAYNLAIVFEDLGQFDMAQKLYLEAEENLLKSKTTKNFLSDVYVGLSLLSFYSGDITKAEEYSEKAMDVGIKSYGEFNPNMTFVYTSYANILESQEKYEESIALLEKSLGIRQSTYGEKHRWTCESYYDLANVYVLIKDYPKAESLYKKAIKIGEETESGPYVANAKNYLAKLYLDQELNLDEARILLTEGLERNKNIYGFNNEVVSENYRYLAKSFQIEKDEDKFFYYLEKSFESAKYDPDSMQRGIAPIQSLHSLLLLSNWYEQKYLEKADIEYLEEPFELINQEIALIGYIQKEFSSDRSRINLANEYRHVYENGLNICWILYHKTKNDKYLEKAFELSEANRNTNLLEELRDIKHRSYAGIPQELLEFENRVKKKLERVKMDIFYEKTSAAPDREVYGQLLDSRIILSNRLDSISNVFRNYPKYRALKYSDKRIKLNDVQKTLDTDTQLISYFLGENFLYSFSISKDTISLLRGDVAKKLLNQTNLLKQKIEDREGLLDLSKNLYLYLMSQQINPNKKEVVIIADNVLNYIPFEILQSEDDTFLLEHHSVSYAGSCRLFLEQNNEFFDFKAPENWAGFSPHYMDESKLAAAEDEIEVLFELTGGHKFVGPDCTKENFLKNNQNYSVLHLAMHAEINQNNPSYNKLLFADGELNASEIYFSKSKANLAILSACNTGFGKLEKGEGVMSMARAFHFSGIPAVVMSLWKVPDRETKMIMISFYEYLKKGKSKSDALRLAKLDYLKNTSDQQLLHPYFWSGFVVNGNTEPIVLGGGINDLLWGGIFLILMLLGVYAFKRFK